MAHLTGKDRTPFASAAPIAILVSAWAGHAAAQTDITDLCDANDGILGETAEICECALTELREAVPADSFEIYADVSARFLGGRGDGLSLVEAWDAGVAAEAEERGVSATGILKATNPTGKAHRDAIRNCEAS